MGQEVFQEGGKIASDWRLIIILSINGPQEHHMVEQVVFQYGGALPPLVPSKIHLDSKGLTEKCPVQSEGMTQHRKWGVCLLSSNPKAPNSGLCSHSSSPPAFPLPESKVSG